MKKILFLLLVFVGGFYFLPAQQNWVDLMTNPEANFYEIQQAFNVYWTNKEKEIPGNGYKAFKRWEYFTESRVYPSGDLSQLGLTDKNFKEFLEKENLIGNNYSSKTNNSLIASSTWTAIGPMGAMTGSASNGLPRKAGRDNFITFHPSNLNTFWVGAPAGGLWKTTNNGSSWTTTTDNLGVIGCTDLAVDPTNVNILYLATGDGYAGDTRSIGVLKSTDGGATWNTTGLTYNVSANFRIRRLIINPTNTQILIAATNSGIWRTTNGGTNWVQEINGNFYDVEFKPGNSSVVYGSSNLAFFLSNDGGDNFTQISSGIPTSGSNRLNIAVTPHDPNYVYVVRSNSSSGFGGLYRSINSGSTFTVMSTTPDVLANSCTGSSGGGQGWYDLAIAVSPTNKDEVVVGGVNHWRSMNGGTNWTCIGCWNSTAANPPYIHADVHDLKYRSDGVLYSTNDGGVYFHTGTSWTDITGTRNIAQIYRIGLSALSPARWMTGHQDNGSNLYNGTQYLARYPGDGMDCFVNWNDDNNLFASSQNGGHVRSTNGGVNWSSATGGITQGGSWLTPFKQDPQVSTTVYSGRATVWKSTNSGGTYSALAATGGAGNIIEFAIAPSNNQIIYVMHSASIRKTTDGGATWTNITGTVPLGSAAPRFIAVKNNDPNTVWVVLGGYSNGNKIFKTTNGGTTWANVTANLPNIPANTVVFDPSSTNEMVYIGMDVGVYYRDNISSTWTLYNSGLPNVPVFDLEISPANPGRLRAATYGRGVWEVDVVSGGPPVSSFSINATTLCTNANILFSDNSLGATSWSWSVTPAANVTITTNTSQNPTFKFGNTGSYVVSMQASNLSGPGNVTNQTITIIASPTVVISSASQTVCSGSSVSVSATGANSFNWSHGGGTSASAVYTPSASTIYSVTGTTNGCTDVKTTSITALALPNIASSASHSILCLGETGTLSASGGTAYIWNPGNQTGNSIIIGPSANTIYTVTGTGANGCTKTSTVSVSVTACAGLLNINGNNTSYKIYPNPASNKVNLNMESEQDLRVNVSLLDGNGKEVYKNMYLFNRNTTHVELLLKEINSGVYFIKISPENGESKLIKLIKE